MKPIRSACVVKSAKAGLREQEARRTEIPRAERRPVVQSEAKWRATDRPLYEKGESKEEEEEKKKHTAHTVVVARSSSSSSTHNSHQYAPMRELEPNRT